MQMIFQGPFSSLNPRMTIADIIAEPLLVNGMGSLEQRRERVRELLDLVHLPAASMNRFPTRSVAAKGSGSALRARSIPR